ncbi:hypothetical protein AY599_20095 [Leptolyngbya valderiana BDU 20041]|nr:hypothetical protein AY599_20095 [Leptolyngbya valderiana BDU 20041]
MSSLDGDVVTIRLEEGDDLPELLRDRGKDVDRIVLCGGDGTVHWALDALMELDRPVGLIPSGTANDLARSLGIPEDPAQAVETINAGLHRSVDVARVGTTSFINAIGLGLGPKTTREMRSEEKSRWGVVSYLLGLFRALRSPPHFSARIRSEDRDLSGRFMQITVANGIHYGGGMTISDQARLDDGLLDVLLVEARSRWRLLANALRFRIGTVENSRILDHWQCRSVRIETDQRIEVTADGEFVASTPIECRVLQAALRVIAPDPSTSNRSA